MIEDTDYTYSKFKENSKDSHGKKRFIKDEIKEAIRFIKPYSSLKDNIISKKIDENGNTTIDERIEREKEVEDAKLLG